MVRKQDLTNALTQEENILLELAGGGIHPRQGPPSRHSSASTHGRRSASEFSDPYINYLSQRINNPERELTHSGYVPSSHSQHWSEGDWGDSEYNVEPEQPEDYIEGHPQKRNTIKDNIVAGIKEALAINDGPPYYKPNKITRDYNRIASLNRIPPSKVWSKEELEYYNKKGIVEYKLIDVKNKNPLLVFDPARPNLVLERKAPNTEYNKPGMYASSRHQHLHNPNPHNYLVS
jgi:hypothetical protein